MALQAENSISGWGSFWERSTLVSWFSTSTVYRPFYVYRMSVPVSSREICPTWTGHPRCGTLLLKSWDSFLVTLPSISLKTCAIYSSVNPGADEFCDWLFLGYSCGSLDTAANFCFFLNVVSFGKKFNSGED